MPGAFGACPEDASKIVRSTSTFPITCIIFSCVTYPGRRIIGSPSDRSIMVDSSPISEEPPSIIISTLPLRSSITYFATVGLGLPERLALGAAMYPPAARISAAAILLEGIRTATVESPPVVAIGTRSVFLKIMVNGPGQKAFARR